MSDDGDYGDIDEFMYRVTLVIIFLITIVFLGAVAGFIWAML